MNDVPPEVLEAREARDRIVALSTEHEQRAHGGEPCLGNRVGLIAFLAHSLGLVAEHMLPVARELERYTEEHVHRFGNGDSLIALHRDDHARLHEEKSRTCPRCERTSHHPIDVLTGWCSACEDFTGDATREELLALAGRLDPDVGEALRRRVELKM